MPMDRSKYPKNWEEISLSIRERAGWVCEWCGVEHNAIITRHIEDSSQFLYIREDGYYTPDGDRVRIDEIDSGFAANDKETRVILTVAHLGIDKPDGTPGDKADRMDCRPENLAALCQRCHLNYDLPDNIQARRKTRIRKTRKAARAAGQLEFWENLAW